MEYIAYIPLFICLPTERYLGCFEVMTIMNTAAINIWYSFLYACKFSAALGKNTIAGLHAKVLFNILRNYKTVLQNEYYLAFSPAKMRVPTVPCVHQPFISFVF